MVLSLTVVSLLALVGAVSSAFAAEALPEAPWWHVNVSSRPSYLAPGGEGTVVVSVTNLGDSEVSAEGLPVTVTDTLPAGIEVRKAYYVAGKRGERSGGAGQPCSVTTSTATTVTCVYNGGVLVPYERLEVIMYVNVGNSVPVGTPVDGVSVSGGGVAPVSVHDPLTVSDSTTPFGVQAYELTPENANGSVDTQAGSHPFQLTNTLVLNAGAETFFGRPVEELGGLLGEVAQPALPKDLRFALPPGLIGNPTPFPQCPETLFHKEICPADTQLGVAVLTIANPIYETEPVPVYNLPPGAGEPARFGWEANGIPVVLDTSVRTGKDYGVTVSSNNTTQTPQFLSAQVTFWGVPGDPRHDRARQGNVSSEGRCLGTIEVSPETCPKDTVKAPFLSLPTSCGNDPFTASMEGDSWSGPSKPSESASATYTLHNALDPSIAMDGCNALAFEPSIKVTPDVTTGSSPTGLNADVHVPQEEVLFPNGDAQATVRDITVALPEGVAVNPAGGDGLGACSEGLVGFTGVAEVGPGLSTQTFTPALPNPLAQGVNFCPDASKIGEVTIHTPLLPNPLKGFVYLASQNENPFGSLVAMYIVAEDPVSGVLVKLPGEVRAEPKQGRS